ncbi:hypothetical protein H310_12211 [Aphanomyces invadans]|uniref:Uncharacterized protein n=1 Tax=Aphanomyces invadans TaxID=157072 RepID=A0A024TJT1_9STRA|nr:hypothetical protein H310_12211 [Aphanomyces invadans]ETV93861.1 hypothetical protein H310_12211 [Aphanomyces invadans]|eukprot:XP_008877421.1 hypothetical protein H310_12211 [Aphanomyces invadans]
MSTNTPSEDLRDAVCDGATAQIVELIASGADVNFIDEDSGWALVLWAVKANQVAALDLLLRHGANVNVCDSSGNTALHKAAYLGYGKCVSLLLRHGAAVTSLNKMQQTPLDLATLFDKPDMATLLSQPSTASST